MDAHVQIYKAETSTAMTGMIEGQKQYLSRLLCVFDALSER